MRRYTFALVLIVSAAALTSLLTPPRAFALQKGSKGKDKANDGVIENYAKSAELKSGHPQQYWIWFDDGVWHLATTTAKMNHKFLGRIDAIGGQFTNLNFGKVEVAGATGDRFLYNEERTAILIGFSTDGGLDTMSFTVSKETTQLKFTLAIDGKAEPKLISVGKAGDHPKSAEFVLPAHPPEPKGGKK